MKLKSIVIAGIIVAFFLSAFTAQAQGIYSDDNKTNTAAPSPNSGGIFRDDDDDDGWGDGGGDTGAPGDNSPVGEGILILSLLAGGYVFVKGKFKNKHED